MENGSHENEDAVCRVCHGEGEPQRPLFHPCRCAGSIKYLHQDCLMEWLRVSKKSDMKCELCGEKFLFRRVYAPNAPTRLSLSEFLLGLAPLLASHLNQVIRILILSAFWIFLMPFGSMWWLNICIGYLSYGTWNWIPPKLTKFDSLVIWWDGVIISSLIAVATCCLILLLRPAFTELVAVLRHQVARNGNPDRVEVVENNELASLAGSQGDDFSQVVSGTATVLNEEDGVEPDQVVEVPPSSSHDEDIDDTHQNGIDHTHQNNIDSDHQNDIDHSHQNNSAGSNYRGDNPETQINDVLEVERNEPIVIPARNLFDLDHVEVPVRNPPAIDVDQQIQEALFTAPLWKSVVFSFIFLANNVVFLTSFLLLPIKLGRFVLSFIIQTILLIHKSPLASLYTPDVMKFNIQHHDPYLYAVLFRSFKNQNYPLPISEDQTDDSFTEAGVNDFNLLHSYGKIPMTVDRMTNKVLLIVEMSVGYLLLLTVVLVIFSLYIVFRERNTQRMNQPTQNQLPNQSLPFFPQNRQRLIHFYSEVMKWLKVFLFLSIEYTVIPHLIGWILDLVTLSVFSSTIQSRLRFFHQNPLICLIIHFVIGLSFTVHVAIVVSELRKVIQPQYLTKFLPHDIFNFDENTFEMVANSTIKMLFERSLVKLSLALPSILFMVLIPTQFGHYLFPGNIPKYQLNYGEISYEVQLPLELLLFHFFLPALIRKYNHSECVRAYVITVLYWCCHTVGLENYFLDQEVIDEFMIKYFPPQPHVPGRNIQILPIANDLDIRHQINEIEESEQQENIQTENEPIVEAKEESISDPNVSPPSAPPRYLLLKCIWILVFFSGATAIIFTLCLHLPLIIGRAMMATLSLQTGNDYYALSGGYSAILGLYFATVHIAKEANNQAELIALGKLIFNGTMIGAKILFLGSIWLTILPLLVGLLIDAIIIIPLWTPHFESPSYSFLQAWAVGLLALTAWIRGVLYGIIGTWRWRTRFQHILLRGIERFDFTFTFFTVTIPLMMTLLDHLLIPYCAARFVGLFYLDSYLQRSLMMRYSFCLYFLLGFSLRSYGFVKDKVIKLHNHIRDSRYLLGTELNNR